VKAFGTLLSRREDCFAETFQLRQRSRITKMFRVCRLHESSETYCYSPGAPGAKQFPCSS
jgi:hypothetical protein